MDDKRKFGPIALLFPVLLIGMLAGAWFFRDLLFSVFASAEKVRETVERAGTWGPLLFMAIQIFQVVVFVIPGEIAQVAGGWLFGVFRGTLYSVVGIGAGSLLNFAAARILGKRFVVGLFGADKLKRFDALVDSPKAEAAFFLLFVIPGLPKDALCFIAGLSPLRPLSFLAVSMIGRLPGIFGSAVMGAAASDGRYGLTICILVVAAVLFGLGAAYGDRIRDLIAESGRRRESRDGRKPPPGAA